MVNPALALALLLASAPEQPQVVEVLADRLPFTDGERISGEFNGLSFLSARGTTPEAPRAALARLTTAFGKKQSIALVAPGGDAAIFWQALGLQKLTPDQEKQMKQALEDAALQATVASYRGSFPPLWAHDMLCTLEVLKWRTCSDPDPIALGIAVQRGLPNLLWHAVMLTRRNGATHYVWAVWPEIDFGGLFAAAHPEERKALCKHAKFPRPTQAVCPIVAIFSTEETRARLEQMEQPAPVDAARSMIQRELEAAGWVAENHSTGNPARSARPMNAGFQQFRHATGKRTLILLVQPATKGSTATYIETGEP